MIGLIQKLENNKKSFRRIAVLALAMPSVFAFCAILMLQVIPPPHTPADYLIVGSFACFASLLTMMGVLFALIRRPGAVEDRPKGLSYSPAESADADAPKD